jgi:hypothetical protein
MSEVDMNPHNLLWAAMFIGETVSPVSMVGLGTK